MTALAKFLTIDTTKKATLLYTLDNRNISGTGTSDSFGSAVAINDDYILVGAPNEDPTYTNAGVVYIYSAVTGGYLSYATALSSSNNYFGNIRLDISNNYAIIGAAGYNSSSGRIIIYNLITNSFVSIIVNPNAYGTSTSDNFGRSIAIDGNYAIVGAYLEDDAGGSDSGKAYIYKTNNGLWTDTALIYTLDNPNAYGTSASDRFGISVDISGNYAIVGAYLEDDASGSDAGKAYIFDVTTGSLVYTLDNPNPYGSSAGDNFGVYVVIEGNYAVVPTYLEDDAGETNSGKVYVYKTTDGSWTDTALIYTLDNPNAYGTGEEDRFGYRVDLSQEFIAVSAYYEDDNTGTNSGKVYVFDLLTGNLLYIVDNPNAYDTTNLDNFGSTVALYGNKLVVGANNEDDATGSSSGKAYVFSLD